MKVLMALTFLDAVDAEEPVFTAEFRSDREQPGYPIMLRAFGSVADTLFSCLPGEKIIVAGSLWNRTKHNHAWIEVDFAFKSDNFINYFFGIGKVFKEPTPSKANSRFTLLTNRTINQKHYYSIVAVGNAASLSQSLLMKGDLVSLEGYIDLVEWKPQECKTQYFLKFTNTIIRRF